CRKFSEFDAPSGLNALLGFFLFLRRTSADQGFQFSIQAGMVSLRQFHETERLETSLSGPHGKQHACAAADAGGAEVEHDGDLNAFVQRAFEREQSSVDGELIHASPKLASVFEQHQSEDGAAELDARAPWSFLLHAGGGGHSPASIAPRGRGRADYESQPSVLAAFPGGWRNRTAHAKMLPQSKETNNETNGCDRIGGLHDDSRSYASQFCAKREESAGCSGGGR